jgi:hypothetical protein
MVTKKEQEIKNDIEREDRFKLDIATARLALAIYDTQIHTDVSERIMDKSSNKEIAVRVFGKEGVGGITSDKVCVRVDNKEARVWLESDLYNSLLKVEPAISPQKSEIVLDKLRRMDSLTEAALGEYAPIFKALSNCGLSIVEVVPSSSLEEIDNKLTRQHDAIENFEVTAEALARYQKYRIAPSKPPMEELNASRVRFEGAVLENELRKALYDLREHEVFKVLNAPGGRKVSVYGFKGRGTVVEDTIIVQLDINEAKIFVEKSFYSAIESRLFKDEKISASDAVSKIMQSPEILVSDPPLPSILKALSKLNIQISELSPLESTEFYKKAELLVEQNWIASNVSRSFDEEATMHEILGSVKDPRRINDALARYGLKETVKERPLLAEEEETTKPAARRKPIPEEQLERELSKRLELMKNRMIDEEVGVIDIVGFGSVNVINLHEDVVINCQNEKVTIIIEEDLLSVALKHAKLASHEDEKLIDNLTLLEGKNEFREFVATVKALKKAGVEKFTITTYGHDADYYLDEARKTCAPAATFIESIASGKSIGETVKILAGSSTTNTLVESLDKTGFSKEAEEVLKYTEQVKITKTKFDKMIDEWVENKAVPNKAGLLKGANSLGMNQKGFETALESAVSEMKESNTHSERNVKYYQDRLNDETLIDAIREEFEGYISSGNQSIEENNARIKKVEEALKVLRGS